MSKCVIKTCLTNLGLDYEAGITFFRCPNVKMMRKWIESIHDNYKQVVSFDEMTTQKICSRHFSKFLIYTEPKTGAVRLMPHAIPKRLNTSISTLESDPMTSSTSATAPDVGVEVHIRNPSRISPSKVERYDDKARRSIKKLENSLEETTEKIKTFSRQALYWQKRYHGCKEQLQKANGINPYTKMPPSTENVTSSKKKIKLTVDDVNSITCRLCLTRDALVNTYSVSGFLNGVLISHSIEKYFSIKIADDDIITEVCENCLAKVDISQSIYEEFGTANKNLENLLREHYPKAESEYSNIEYVENLNEDQPQPEHLVDLKAESEDPNLANYEQCSSILIKNEYFEQNEDDDENLVFESETADFDSLSDSSIDQHPFFTEWNVVPAPSARTDNKFEPKFKAKLCDICGKFFALTSKHIKLAHIVKAPMEQAYVCDLCGKKFTAPGSLMRHTMVFHENSNRFICTVCGTEFNRPDNLKKHYDRLHVQLNIMEPRKRRPVFRIPSQHENKCPICSKSFNFHRHIVAHLDIEHPGHGIEVLSCDFLNCEKKFISENDLELHRNSHICSKSRLPCRYCRKTFNKQKSLEVHEKKHEKGYFECDRCSSKFTSFTALFRHKKLHTIGHINEKYKFNCELCSLSYSRIAELTKHQKAVHRMITLKKEEINDDELGIMEVEVETLEEYKADIVYI